MTAKKLPDNYHLLFSALVSDALDAVGVRDCAMPSHIRPLDESLQLCGRARTGIYMEVAHVEEGVNPYELEIKLVDDLKVNDIAVLACGGSGRIAPWGGLLSTATVGRGAAGCITDGFVRDIKTIRELKLPVYHGGIAPLDSKGRGQIMAIDVPVICAGVRVKSGDLIIGDADGVVVVPQEIEDEVLAVAFNKLEGEDRSSSELRSGGYLRDVYARYGVL
ncbi:RraA family protein [Brucella pituitosa]|uniref:RraA family protein n=1 Tax=Brucella pituitosa TaxID=571256 RepID=UPI000C27DCC1|nr:dimethylmenaquinone methyltransferase [Brucella pituitosa]PQZ47858.1 dimethylmenaquinone methyltransferase [Ochrobactrum sp. MYb19]PRA52746.1 dimethylmenaquinone methyltransferase [Ochrobactrum sp. MYb68]PRA63532.1 dimethylmenaquinone methyltransferase [Ochrobactrum sp. MYb18]PRA73578.1 dimethylmenaquinone methyltransferase [Brucella thiophenivorans]PRA86736.1 dimethylmenaquinone methyltransferase [Ochrobactrum sp. MYb14]PRA94634.1 dimethylmenaquinone methyltransferase [Ochrobactrum sp. MY